MKTTVPPATPLDPKTTFTLDGAKQAFGISDFWQYTLSDLVSNMNRGALAEFIVERALGATKCLSNHAEPYDITYRGTHIEVKSSAFVQRWPQDKASSPKFSVRKKLCRNSETSRFDEPPSRRWDIIVCALLAERDPLKLNPMALEQWEFYVVSKQNIESIAQFSNAANLTLKHLDRPLGVIPCGYGGLKQAVDTLID